MLWLVLFLLISPAVAAVPPGRITVQSTPTGAIACVDNTSCDITGATFTVEGNAWHTVRIMEKGYREWTEQVYVTSDQISLLEAYLDLDPAATGIRVVVSPTGSVVCLDNTNCRTNVGSANGTLYTGVNPGYHTISVEAPPEFEDTTKLVKVELGKVTDVNIALSAFVVPASTTELTKATGTVRIYVDRTGSTICLDNTDCFVNVGGAPGTGTGTVFFSNVPAGEQHIVSIVADGYQPVSQKVSVTKDLITTLDVKMLPMTDQGTGAPETTPASTPSLPATTPSMPTRSGLDTTCVLGALFVCSALLACRCRRS